LYNAHHVQANKRVLLGRVEQRQSFEVVKRSKNVR